MKRIALILIALALTSCANMPLTTMASEDSRIFYDGAMTFDDKSVLVKFQFESPKTIKEFCGKGSAACTVKMGEMYFVYVEKPRSWNDRRVLELIGHEALHFLGAHHNDEDPRK